MVPIVNKTRGPTHPLVTGCRLSDKKEKKRKENGFAFGGEGLFFVIIRDLRILLQRTKIVLCHAFVT
jgi:hypothetical protein